MEPKYIKVNSMMKDGSKQSLRAILFFGRLRLTFAEIVGCRFFVILRGTVHATEHTAKVFGMWTVPG